MKKESKIRCKSILKLLIIGFVFLFLLNIGFVSAEKIASSGTTRSTLPAYTSTTGSLTIVYSWSGKPDLDTGTYVFGNSFGWSCNGNSPYVSWSGDNTATGGSETVIINLAGSGTAGLWGFNTGLNIGLRAGWYSPAGGSGPAQITVTYNGVSKTCSIQPGSQNGCASTSVGSISLSSANQITLSCNGCFNGETRCRDSNIRQTCQNNVWGSNYGCALSGGSCAIGSCQNNGCVSTPINCNDGNPCTSDSCSGGICSHSPISDLACSRSSSNSDGCCPSGCSPKPSDSNYDFDCNKCAYIYCDDDGNPCTDGSCNPATGRCTQTPKTCNPSSSDNCCPTGCSSNPSDGINFGYDVDCNKCLTKNCSDGNKCNGLETCNSATGICQPGTPPDCNPSISDNCCPPGCSPNHFLGTEDIDCKCSSNSQCSNDDSCDGAEICNPATKICEAGTLPNCNDNKYCTYDDCNPLSGCSNNPVPMEDETCPLPTGLSSLSPWKSFWNSLLKMFGITGKVITGNVVAEQGVCKKGVCTACVPNCIGKTCGASDGCGGVCGGSCQPKKFCQYDYSENPLKTPCKDKSDCQKFNILDSKGNPKKSCDDCIPLDSPDCSIDGKCCGTFTQESYECANKNKIPENMMTSYIMRYNKEWTRSFDGTNCQKTSKILKQEIFSECSFCKKCGEIINSPPTNLDALKYDVDNVGQEIEIQTPEFICGEGKVSLIIDTTFGKIEGRIIDNGDCIIQSLSRVKMKIGLKPGLIGENIAKIKLIYYNGYTPYEKEVFIMVPKNCYNQPVGQYNGCLPDLSKNNVVCKPALPQKVIDKCTPPPEDDKCFDGECVDSGCKGIKNAYNFKEITGAYITFFDTKTPENNPGYVSCMKTICTALMNTKKKPKIPINQVNVNIPNKDYCGLSHQGSFSIYGLKCCIEELIVHELGHNNQQERGELENEFKRISGDHYGPEWIEGTVGEGGIIAAQRWKVPPAIFSYGPHYGIIRPYGANNKAEDVATFVEAVVAGTGNVDWAALIEPDSKYIYKQRYLDKLKLLYDYGEISCEQYFNILSKAGIDITNINP